jgi:hypothetical protein
MFYSASSYKPGQIYYTTNYPRKKRLVRLLIRRLNENEDFHDGWGNRGGKTPFGWYWYCLDLITGEENVTLDNVFMTWQRL